MLIRNVGYDYSKYKNIGTEGAGISHSTYLPAWEILEKNGLSEPMTPRWLDEGKDV